ncbi:MAG: T9SS type A sorting domain-containing protein [bacterium]|nr:T9SS type A sorting domain-containing protein [bacterium]
MIAGTEDYYSNEQNNYYIDIIPELINEIPTEGNDKGAISWGTCYVLEEAIYSLKVNYSNIVAQNIKNEIDGILLLRDDIRGVPSYIDTNGQEKVLKTWRGLKFSRIMRNDSMFSCYGDGTLNKIVYNGPENGIPSKYFAYPDEVLTGRILQTILRFVVAIDTIGKWDEIGGFSYRSRLINDCKESYNEYLDCFQDTIINDDNYCGAWKHFADIIYKDFNDGICQIDKFYPQFPFVANSRSAFNKNSTMADAGLFLYELTGEDIFMQQTQKFAHYFRNNMDDSSFVFNSDSAMVWAYSVAYSFGGADDISHGGLSVIYVNDYYREFPGNVFSRNDMIKIFNTIKHLMIVDGSGTEGFYNFHSYLDGEYHLNPFFDVGKFNGYLFKFYGLTEYMPQTIEFINGRKSSLEIDNGYFNYYKKYYNPFSINVKIGEMPVSPEDSQQIDAFSDMVYVELKSLSNYTGNKDTIIVELYDPDSKAQFHLFDTLYNVIAGRTYNVPFDYLVFDGETLTTDTLVAKAYALREGAVNCPFLSDTLPLVARDTIYMFNTNEMPVLKNSTFNVYTCYRNKNLDMFGIDSVKVTITYDTITEMGLIEKATIIEYTDSNGRAQFELRTETTYPVIIRAEKLGYFAKTDTIMPYMWSTTKEAMGPNSSKHVIKNDKDGSVHLIYTDGDSIVHGRSTDFGANWELEKIGHGDYASITQIIDTDSVGMAAVWKDGESWVYDWSMSPWVGEDTVSPTVMGYRNPVITANPSNRTEVWLGGIMTNYGTLDNNWTLQYAKFGYRNPDASQITEIIGEEGDYNSFEDYLAKPYNYASIGSKVWGSLYGAVIAFEDTNGEIIEKQFDPYEGVWTVSTNRSNTSTKSSNPFVNTENYTDVNKVIWEEEGSPSGAYGSRIYLDNARFKYDKTETDKKYPKIIKGIVSYVESGNKVVINPQLYDSTKANIVLSSSDSCYYPDFLDSTKINFTLGKKYYCVKALWTQKIGSEYRIKSGYAEIITDTTNGWIIGNIPLTLADTAILTEGVTSYLKDYLPSGDKQKIERISSTMTGLNKYKDYLLVVKTTNPNKNQPYVVAVDQKLSAVITDKEAITEVVLKSSDYEDGEIGVYLDRVKGSPNRTVEFNLYEYDEIIGGATVLKGTNILKLTDENEGIEEKVEMSRINGKRIKMSINSLTDSEIGIELIDITGRVVLKETEKIKKGKNQIRMTTEGLSSGVYFYRMKKDGAETMSGKLTVIK